MVELDIRTLFIVCGFLAGGMFISLQGLRQSLTKKSGTGFWTTAMLAITLGVFLLSFRNFLPEFLTIICANLLILIGFILILHGLLIFINSPPCHLFELLLFISVLLSMSYFTYVDNIVGARVIVMSLSMSLISIKIIASVLNKKHAPWYSAGLALAGVYFVYGLAMAARVPIELIGDLNTPFMDRNGWAAILILSLIFVIVGSSASLILLALKSVESERMILSQAVSQSAAAIIITDINGAIQYVNPAFTHKTGYKFEEVQGKNPRILRPDDPNALDFAGLWKTILSGKTWRGEFKNKKKNGELFWEIGSIAPVRQNDGQITHFVAVKEDCTALKNAEESIRHLAHHDALTGLASRTLARDRLDKAISISNRNSTSTAVLYIDIDGFKQINDTWGHDAGDNTLKEVASTLESCVRDADTVARIGGDEFAVFLTDIESVEGVSFVAKKIIESIANLPLSVDSNIGVSVGIALYPENGSTYDELLLLADQAMYKVKRQGKNNFKFYQKEAG